MIKTNLTQPITIDGSMIIIPAEEYQLLRREAGYSPTPMLDKRIKNARKRYREGNTLNWNKVKNDLKHCIDSEQIYR